MSSRQTTTQDNKPYAAAQPLIDQGLSDAQQMYDSGGFNITPYQGDLVADPTALQQAAYSAAPGVAMGAMQGGQAAQAGLMRALDPNIRSDAYGQVRQNVIDTIMPSINSSFAGSGMTGSTLHAQNLAKGLSAGLAEVDNRAFQQGEQRALQAAAMMPGINQSLTQPISFLRDVGGEQQQQAQAEINAAALRDQQAKTADLNALQDYLALSTGAGGMFGVQSATRSSSPGLMGILGGAGQAAPLLPYLAASDRRVKKDIEPVGQRNGWNWYKFRYTWDDDDAPLREGVMADEVAQILPEAVIRHHSGYDMVDYSQLGLA